MITRPRHQSPIQSLQALGEGLSRRTLSPEPAQLLAWEGAKLTRRQDDTTLKAGEVP